MIIDSHLHFFDQPVAQDPQHPDHLSLDEVLRQARAIGIDKIVQVTPIASGYDNSYGLAMARQRPGDVLGCIARLDLLDPAVEDKLSDLLRHPQMLALRITLIDPYNEAWLAERKLDRFFETASRLGAPIELFAPFRVGEMHDTVRRFPGVRWLIDHMGLRYYAGQDNTGAFRQWDALLALAREPNAWIKCSYFPEAAKDIETYPYPESQHYLRRLVEHAGSERLIWGSNFPNVRRACPYAQALDFIRSASSFLSPQDRDAMLGGNLLRYVERN